MHIYIHSRIHTHAYVQFLEACLDHSAYTYTYAHTYIYIYIYIYTLKHIDAHTRTIPRRMPRPQRRSAIPPHTHLYIHIRIHVYKHTHIQFLGACLDHSAGPQFLLTEYCERGSLEDLLNSQVNILKGRAVFFFYSTFTGELTFENVDLRNFPVGTLSHRILVVKSQKYRKMLIYGKLKRSAVSPPRILLAADQHSQKSAR